MGGGHLEVWQRVSHFIYYLHCKYSRHLRNYIPLKESVNMEMNASVWFPCMKKMNTMSLKIKGMEKHRR